MRIGIIAVLGVCLLPTTLQAQLKARPPGEPPAPGTPRREILHGGEPIPRNMVWRPEPGRQNWVQVEVNSCEWCREPMTWKQAAFDKKALPLWLTAVALAVADTEYTMSRPCFRAGTCTEWNPLLGRTRAQQYGVRMPALALAWLGTSWARKGNADYNIGGMRHWYAIPVMFLTMPVVGLVINSSR